MTSAQNLNETSQRLVAPEFRPAAAYLLKGSPRLPPNLSLVRVDDSDVGPILTHRDDIVVGHSIRTTKSWEPSEGRFLRSVLRPGMNAIDVGANIGYFTLLMSGLVGANGHVLAVEAEPDTFQLLRANIELNDLRNVSAVPVAAHRAAGLVTITRNPHNHGGSSAVHTWADWSTAPVQAVRLDDVLNPDLPIDVVKIDIEGMDHAAVEGLERTLARWRPLFLVEFNPIWIEVLGEVPTEILRYYRDLGYQIRLLGGDALRLQREAGMAIDELLLDNLEVSHRNEGELIERTKRIHFINLILTKLESQGAWRRSRD